MRKLTLLGGLVLCMGLVSVQDAGAAQRTRSVRPTGENPLLNDSRQPAALTRGGLHIVAHRVHDDAYGVSALDQRASNTVQRNIRFKAMTVDNDLSQLSDKHRAQLRSRMDTRARTRNIRFRAMNAAEARARQDATDTEK